ncbi:MAG: hypothetical protein Kow00133_21280 [Amphiplicatus sp.]
MAFSMIRSSGHQKSRDKSDRKGPFSGFLGRRSNAQEPDDMPQMDVVGGLTRALRKTAPKDAAPQGEDDGPIREALASIECALYSIDAIRDVIEQAYEVTLSAQNVEDAGGRALLAERYDELRLSINRIIEQLDDRAARLIGRNAHNLDVKLGGKANYSVSAIRMDVSPKGLELDPPREAFATFDEITRVMEELDNAVKKADRAAAGYCRDAQFLISRLSQQAAA